jgi:hypothetical protein
MPMSTPPESEPEIRIEHFSNPRSFGLTPLLMSGALMQILGNHFASRDRIEHAPLRDYLWRADIKDGILIANITTWDPQAVERRPAIIVKSNAWQPGEPLAIGNRLTLGPDGYEHFSVLMHGSHTLFCLAGEGDEALVLAAEVFRELLTFSSVIRCDLDLIRFGVAEFGQVYKLQEATENYAVPVTVAYASNLTWSIEPDAPKLKRIVLSANLLKPKDLGGWIWGPGSP